MTERQPATQARPSPPKAPKTSPNPPFEVEDRTDPEFQELVAEAILLRQWVEQERAAGNRPN